MAQAFTFGLSRYEHHLALRINSMAETQEQHALDSLRALKPGIWSKRYGLQVVEQGDTMAASWSAE